MHERWGEVEMKQFSEGATKDACNAFNEGVVEVEVLMRRHE